MTPCAVLVWKKGRSRGCLNPAVGKLADGRAACGTHLRIERVNAELAGRGAV